jgi:DNA-binding NtrC family response regulator
VSGGRVLIVDDDETFARTLGRSLRRRGYDVSTCGSAAEARETIPVDIVDVVVLDYQLPDANGLELLEELRPLAAGAAFLMATAFPRLEVAVEAMRRGAFDYVAKGGELEECLIRVDRAYEVSALRRRMAEASTSSDAAKDLVGDSPPMLSLKHRLKLLAGADDTTVQILGETGTGKGMIARAIHAASGRAYEPFVAVDCTTIPETLVESELFGHERGAFSGATGTKMGRVEAAGKGTLFLDEIGELDLSVQAKLLRLLEEREYTRVGGTRPRHLDARIIAATNRNLELAVEEGRFRADLRYRLEVFVVETPPLRDRGEDIMVLVAHFIGTHARALGKPVPGLSETVIEGLRRYAFPGNVRELRNMIEQAMLLVQGEVLTLADFPVLARSVRSVSARRPARRVPAAPVVDLATIRQEAESDERARVVEALRDEAGNVSAAARRLNLSRYQLIRRLKKLGLRS